MNEPDEHGGPGPRGRDVQSDGRDGPAERNEAAPSIEARARAGRTTWVEVSARALEENFRALATHVGVPVCAVVKANGYGHGLAIAARAFARAGAAMLAVTRIEEARALRDAGIEAPVLVLMPAPDPAEAVKLGCEVTVGSVEEIAALPPAARAHLKVDTGMGRLGVDPNEAAAAARAIAARATLAAVWTHFSNAAGPGGRAQLERFRTVVTTLRHEGLAFAAHAANSPATLALPGSRFDMVRVGTLLYGQNPPGAIAPWPRRETFAWYARVAAVRTVAPGATVGYGSEWTAPRRARLATIPIGYADGFTVEPHARTPSLRETARGLGRAVAGAARREDTRAVFFGDRAAPVAGRVAMHAVTVDVTDLPDVGVGTPVRIPARRLMVDAAIERIETDR